MHRTKTNVNIQETAEEEAKCSGISRYQNKCFVFCARCQQVKVLSVL